MKITDKDIEPVWIQVSYQVNTQVWVQVMDQVGGLVWNDLHENYS